MSTGTLQRDVGAQAMLQLLDEDPALRKVLYLTTLLLRIIVQCHLFLYLNWLTCL